MPDGTTSHGIGQKVLGGFCVLVGRALLIGGMPRFGVGLRMVISPGPSDSQGTTAGRLGYLTGTILVMGLAYLLVRFGLGRFKPRELPAAERKSDAQDDAGGQPG